MFENTSQNTRNKTFVYNVSQFPKLDKKQLHTCVSCNGISSLHILFILKVSHFCLIAYLLYKKKIKALKN